MDWGRIVTELLIALLPLLVLVITGAIAYGAAYIKQRYIWAKEARVVGAVESTVRDVVLSLQQRVVDDLKAANADGKLTAAEKDEIKRNALQTLQQQITKGQQAILQAITADVTGWLANKLERALVEHKLEVATANPTILDAAPILEPSE